MLPARAHAQAASSPPTPSAATPAALPVDAARALFREGASLIEQGEWAEALAKFEQSHATRPHSVTLFNIAVCYRYLNRATMSLETLKRALARHGTTSELPEGILEQARAYGAELEQRLVTFDVTLSPETAAIAVDGRPLTRGAEGEWVAGIAPPGSGKSVGARSFRVRADPGPVVFFVTSEGMEPIEVKRDASPGARVPLALSMREQPASIAIAANLRDPGKRGTSTWRTPGGHHTAPGRIPSRLHAKGTVDGQAWVTLPGQSSPTRVSTSTTCRSPKGGGSGTESAFSPRASASVGSAPTTRPGPSPRVARRRRQRQRASPLFP